MQCDRAQEFFSDYLERVLDRPMTAALEAHLAGCARCREGLAGLRETCLALEAVPEVEPPVDGAWRVMLQLREVRAAQIEAERRRSVTFVDWLRSLTPMGVAMGASMATLVIGGTLLFSGLAHERLLILPVGQGSSPRAQSTAMPTVAASYGPITSAGQQVDIQVTPATDLVDAQVQVMGGGLPIHSLSHVDIGPNRPLICPVILPPSASPAAQVLRVEVQSRALDRKYEHLVVVPVGPRQAASVTLVFANLPLEEALRRLGPSLGRPVVVDGVTEGTISLQADEQKPRDCLGDVAAQLRATLREENGVYRIAPQE